QTLSRVQIPPPPPTTRTNTGRDHRQVPGPHHAYGTSPYVHVSRRRGRAQSGDDVLVADLVLQVRSRLPRVVRRDAPSVPERVEQPAVASVWRVRDRPFYLGAGSHSLLEHSVDVLHLEDERHRSSPDRRGTVDATLRPLVGQEEPSAVDDELSVADHAG